jgi:Helix-turn-helix domain
MANNCEHYAKGKFCQCFKKDTQLRYRASEEQIQEMIQMRKAGFSFSAIGRKFGKDHSTILYHCKKAELFKFRTPRGKKRDKTWAVYDASPRPEIIEDGEVINSGKDYIDYLAEENDRKWKKRKDIASV